ncbi:MAG: sodium:solute symporter [Cytophagales bacterium]|nr:MAG: sodium:solute symporter [Cytophagales bacterium]TAF62516.1 MAG: sodium:solute symporter [Cytophagales bacterium]
MEKHWIFLIILIAYFLVLIIIAEITAKGATKDTFFIANRSSSWYLVAFGMIGASLSGVTFISVPGSVLTKSFSYFQMVLGYLLGYLVIGTVLMPLYYRLNLVSIYTYLEQRFGFWSYKTGAFFFLLARTVGASLRLYLSAMVLHLALFEPLGMSFWQTAILSIALIWVYTYKGGIKTIVWTDTLQTFFMIAAILGCVWLIAQNLDWSLLQTVNEVNASPLSQIFFWESLDIKFFPKQFMAGAFVALVMTGLDQDMMQKNLTCRSIGEAQKNMFWFTLVLVFVNFIFLMLGALLYIYAEVKGISLPMKDGVVITDKVFPFLALEHFGLGVGILFMLGVVASTYASADSALASLTTSFCVDFLNIYQEKDESKQKLQLRYVHIGFSALLVVMILLFSLLVEQYPSTNVISIVFRAAGYTYGPLLGLYTLGLLTKRQIRDKFVPYVCVIGPCLGYFVSEWLAKNVSYKFTDEIIVLIGIITFLGLWGISTSPKTKTQD